MRISYWMPRARNTHPEYVILIDFPLQQCLHQRASVLRYAYISCFLCSYVEILHLVCPVIQNPYVCLLSRPLRFHIAKRERELHLLNNSAFSVVRRRCARLYRTGPDGVVCTLSSVLEVPASIPDSDGCIC